MLSARFSLVLLLVVPAACAAPTSDDRAETAASAATVEHSYAMVFGYQDALNRPRNSHTFATFVRARRDAQGVLEIIGQQDISWLPAAFTGSVCVLGCRPEPGHNYDLTETLGFFAQASASYRMRAAVWGPYEVPASLYDAAVAESAWLDSGDVQYIAEDARTSGPAFAMQPGGAYNCAAASTGFFPTPWSAREPEFRRGPLQWGLRASEAGAEALAGNGFAVAPLADARVLFAATGVSGRGIEWRTPTR